MRHAWERTAHVTEWVVEKMLFKARIILVPLYFGLVIGALVAVLKFGEELFLHIIPHVWEWSEEQLVIALLNLIDLTLIANLLIMVGLASYENFVSALVEQGHKDRPHWLDEVDFSSMKLKLIGSVVAIGAIQLLGRFLQLEGELSDAIMIGGGMLIVIALAALLLAYADKVGHSKDH